MLVLGLAVWPLAHTLLGRLPDRGYSLLKPLGLLLVSYLFWLGGSFGFWANGLGGILAGLAGVTAVSLLIYRHARQTTEMPCLRTWFQQEKRYIFLVEGLFLFLFVLWVIARAYNPAIQHTEKPMEFAFLNAAFHSPHFPLHDPWLSGFAISYYYFGYVMTAVVGRLAFVTEAVAFNLGVAWLMAGTAVGAFGLVYNLIMAEGIGRRLTQMDADMKKSASSASSASLPILKPSERQARGRLGLRGQAVLWGLLAALALPLAGNNQMMLEIFHANGLGSSEFWSWLDIRDIDGPPQPGVEPARYQGGGLWWWWRSSRIIREYHLSGRAEEGLEPITEFPGFSFVLGDLHPHVLALPFAFLCLGLALQFWLSDQRLTIQEWLPDPRRRLRQVKVTSWALWGLTAVALGGLSFLNTWDVLIHLFILVGAIILAQWRRRGRWDNQLLSLAVLVGGVLTAAAVILYLPFYLGFRSQAGPPFILPMLMRPTRLAQYLVIFGMPLLPVLLLTIGLLCQQRLRHWQTSLKWGAGLLAGLILLMLLMSWIIAANPDGAGRVIRLAQELGHQLPPQPDGSVLAQIWWGLGAVTLLTPQLLLVRLQFPWLILLLAGLVAAVIAVWRYRLDREQPAPGTLSGGEKAGSVLSPAPAEQLPQAQPAAALPFVLLLVLTGALLTLGPEFVYLRDQFGQRLNTIFKFYFQAWIFFGIAAIFALSYLQRQWRVAGWLATAAYLILLLFALQFPYYGLASRSEFYRGPATLTNRAPVTLNGLAHIAHGNPDEYAALQWVRENTAATAVILEAVGGPYSDYGRVAANTGRPTLLGWANHQYQWRGSDHPEPGPRDAAVRTIYSQPGWEGVIDLLNRYEIDYIYVGHLERLQYGWAGLEKFDRLPVAFANDNVTIYIWPRGQ
jgi:YYY domain-containing protein